jgi:hypothetical protein
VFPNHPIARLLCLCVVVPLLVASSYGDTLTEICEKLDRLAKARSYQIGTDKCRQIGDRNSSAMIGEDDYLIQERYLHLRANLCQSLADEQRDAQNRREVSDEALTCWEDYFQWLKNLPSEQRAAIMTSNSTAKGRKIWAAAAAIGATAVSAEKPGDALVDYESLVEDNSWFGPDAFNWWLAVLRYPDVPKKVSDKIFPMTGDDEVKLRAMVMSTGKTEHWRRFASRLGNGSPAQIRQKFLDRLNTILPATSPPPVAEQ